MSCLKISIRMSYICRVCYDYMYDEVGSNDRNLLNQIYEVGKEVDSSDMNL